MTSVARGVTRRGASVGLVGGGRSDVDEDICRCVEDVVRRAIAYDVEKQGVKTGVPSGIGELEDGPLGPIAPVVRMASMRP